MSVRENGDRNANEIRPEALGGTSGVKPLPVGLVVATGYREGARWRPRQLLPGRAVMALLDHTVSVRRKPERALNTLRQVVTDAVALKGVRGEATEVAETLLARLAEKAGRGSVVT